MANFGQEVIYRLRDLGYYGEFNERDVSRICRTQPKLKHLFTFIRDELTAKDNILHQTELEEEEKWAKQTGGLGATMISEKIFQTTVESTLGMHDEATIEEAEIETLSAEIELMEKQLRVREFQEDLLKRESHMLDSKIEVLETKQIAEISAIEDSVNSSAAKTYREVQQSLEAVTFALEKTLQQIHHLSLDSTRPEEQATKQLLAEFPDKVLPQRAVQVKQVVNDIVSEVGKSTESTLRQLRELLNEQTLRSDGLSQNQVQPDITGGNCSEMARLKEQLFLARKDLVCAQVMNERWKDTLTQLKKINANPQRALDPVDMAAFANLQQQNAQTMGQILDLTLAQVETSYDLDIQQQDSQIRVNSQHLLDQQSQRQVLMESVSQIHTLLDKVQGLVWLAQCLTQADTDSTQDTLDKVQSVIGMAQVCTETLDQEHSELDRILVQSSLSTVAVNETEKEAQRSLRQTVDERDAFLSGLNQILKEADVIQKKLGLRPVQKKNQNDKGQQLADTSLYIDRKELIDRVVTALHPQVKEKVPEADQLQRIAVSQIFKSTMEVETADLVSESLIEEREGKIKKLLNKLGEANRQLSDAVDTDERQHTKIFGHSLLRQEEIAGDFVRGPKGQNKLESACNV